MRNVIIPSTVILGLFAMIGTALVAFTFDVTRERIAATERADLLRNLHRIVPAERHDNDLFADTVQVVAPEFLGTSAPVTVYRARMDDKPVAVVLSPVAPDGYSGDIHLLIGIYEDGTLAGVRVISHRETPGLGDFIEESRSDWILKFTGRSLQAPAEAQWGVKKDGGVFDQFTGATITPRAVVKAVRKALVYFRQYKDELFAPQQSVAGAEDSTPSR